MTETLLIRDAHLLDPAAGILTDLSWMEISAGLIADSGTGAPPSPAAGTRIIDAAGATVIPGLVDAYVHLILTTFDLVDAAFWTAGHSAVCALDEAGRMLRLGLTTVRDVGGADWGMARALDEGLAVGPRLVFGGKALSQTGGHGDLRSRGDDLVERRCHAPRQQHLQVRSPVAELIARGPADCFDTIGDPGEGRTGLAARQPVSEVQYSDDEMRTPVAEADNHNRYVTVHAYHPRGVNRALRAGVRCVEHGNLLDDETITLLLDHDAFLVPTLVTYDKMDKFGRQTGIPARSLQKNAGVRDAGLCALEKAHRAGVKPGLRQ